MNQGRYLLAGGLWLCVAVSAMGYHDPTRPWFYHSPIAEQPEQEYVLSAIITDHATRLALVNGKLVREGDMLGGGKVVRIGTSVVELDTPGGKITLSLKRGAVKSPAAVSTTEDLQGGMQ